MEVELTAVLAHKPSCITHDVQPMEHRYMIISEELERPTRLLRCPTEKYLGIGIGRIQPHVPFSALETLQSEMDQRSKTLQEKGCDPPCGKKSQVDKADIWYF